MKQLEITGLNEQSAQKVAEKLNELLADYHVFYMNLRGLHWNIVGKQFFSMHGKFEELYDNVAEKIDEIAERILSLGFTPAHSLKEYTEMAQLAPVTNVTEAQPSIEAVLEGFKYLIAAQRQVLELTDEHNDEATNALMSDYISEQEKLAWMFNATLQ